MFSTAYYFTASYYYYCLGVVISKSQHFALQGGQWLVVRMHNPFICC